MTDRLPDLAARPRRRRLSASSLSALWCCFERQSERRLWQRPWECPRPKRLKRPKEPEAETRRSVLQTGAGAGAPLNSEVRVEDAPEVV